MDNFGKNKYLFFMIWLNNYNLTIFHPLFSLKRESTNLRSN